MAKKQHSGIPPVGGSSLLVIFAVLCLTCFALLSLSTVRASGRLGDAAAQSTAAYYQADCQAETILARLRAGERPPEVTENGTLYTYACPISDTQTLQVAVRITGEDYTILRWQAVSTTDWKPDDSLVVWDGGTP